MRSLARNLCASKEGVLHHVQVAPLQVRSPFLSIARVPCLTNTQWDRVPRKERIHVCFLTGPSLRLCVFA